MIRRRGVLRLRTLVVGLVTLLAASAASGSLPFDVSLSVEYGNPRGPTSVTRELELELLAQLDRAGCFDRVELDAAPADEGVAERLELLVRLDDFLERIEFEMSLAQRAQNSAPQEAAQRQVASAEARVRVDILLANTSLSVRSRRFATRASWRPLFMEDPAEEARTRLVQEVARSVREFACKGSASKWNRWIRRARERPATD